MFTGQSHIPTEGEYSTGAAETQTLPHSVLTAAVPWQPVLSDPSRFRMHLSLEPSNEAVSAMDNDPGRAFSVYLILTALRLWELLKVCDLKQNPS